MELAARLGLPLGIVFSLVVASFTNLKFIVLLLSAFAVSLVLEATSIYFLYHEIKCPQCGKVLTRFGNGKKMPIKQAYATLNGCKPCRHCGWQPECQAEKT